jgi:predicted Fe-Mo cluster-binding NifX family protein
MKIAISAAADTGLAAPFDGRFGRAAYFTIIETDTDTAETLANAAVNAAGGAGTQAARFIAEQGVQAVISGHIGPKAERALAAAGIAMFLAPAGEHTVSNLLAGYKAGQLKRQGS